MRSYCVLSLVTIIGLFMLGCAAPQSPPPERYYLDGSPLVHPLQDSLERSTRVEPASPIPATIIADTNTPVPGGQGNFTFFTFPTIGGYGVAFQGSDASQDNNIFISSGGQLEVLVRENAPYPELGAFTSLGRPSAGDDQVAFWGEGLLGGPGIYTARHNELSVVANTLIAVPGGTGNFTKFGTDIPGIAGNLVAFVGYSEDGKPGVYAGTPGAGEVSLVANSQTAVPEGQGNFTSFSGPAVSGNQVAFFANNTSTSPIQAGIYIAEVGGAVIKVADLQTAAPDGSGMFQGFTVPTLSNGVVAFVSINQSGSGVYRWASGSLTTVANVNTQVPGQQATFGGFNNSAPSSAGSTIAFNATSSEGITGNYASANGVLVKVLDERDTIDGQTSIGAGLGLDTHQLAADGTLAFYDLLANGVYGIYTAPVPSP